MANGPILISGVDIQPKGQFLFQPFVFGQIGHEKFGNQLSVNSTDSPTHLRAVAPTGIFAYGISNHVELNVAFSGIYWEASRAGGSNGRTVDSESGVGDTTIYLKYRPIIQDPDGWRPSVTIYNQVALPSSQWFGTQGIPGGFSPAGPAACSLLPDKITSMPSIPTSHCTITGTRETCHAVIVPWSCPRVGRSAQISRRGSPEIQVTLPSEPGNRLICPKSRRELVETAVDGLRQSR